MGQRRATVRSNRRKELDVEPEAWLLRVDQVMWLRDTAVQDLHWFGRGGDHPRVIPLTVITFCTIYSCILLIVRRTKPFPQSTNYRPCRSSAPHCQRLVTPSTLCCYP